MYIDLNYSPPKLLTCKLNGLDGFLLNFKSITARMCPLYIFCTLHEFLIPENNVCVTFCQVCWVNNTIMTLTKVKGQRPIFVYVALWLRVAKYKVLCGPFLCTGFLNNTPSYIQLSSKEAIDNRTKCIITMLLVSIKFILNTKRKVYSIIFHSVFFFSSKLFSLTSQNLANVINVSLLWQEFQLVAILTHSAWKSGEISGKGRGQPFKCLNFQRNLLLKYSCLQHTFVTL